MGNIAVGYAVNTKNAESSLSSFPNRVVCRGDEKIGLTIVQPVSMAFEIFQVLAKNAPDWAGWR